MSRFRLLMGARASSTPPIPPADILTPSAAYDGAAGSGFGAPYEEIPEDPARVTAKPTGRLLNVHRTPYTGTQVLVVTAECGRVAGVGGVRDVEFFAEGVKITVSARTFTIHNDANGDAKVWYGYACELDWETFRSASSLPEVHVYARINPVNEALQSRVIGPFSFYPRNSGVGAGCEFDKEIFVDREAVSDTAGVRYNTIKKALDYFTPAGAGSSFQFPVITLEKSGDHIFKDAVASATGARSRFTVIRAALSGTVIGDGSANGPSGGYLYDGLCFRGANLQLDLAKISPNLKGFRLATTSNKLLWFDGCEFMCGDNNYLEGSGSGMAALWQGVEPRVYWINSPDTTSFFEVYWTSVYAHDLPAYGLSACAMVRDCILDGCGGTAHENIHGIIYNTKTSRVGGILSGLRVHQNAFTLAYTGAGSATYECSGNTGGQTRTFKLKVDGAEVYSKLLDRAENEVVQVAELVTEIDALADWAAVLADPAPTRAACYLSRADLQSQPIPVTAVTSTPVQLTTFVDVHANVGQWQGVGRTYESAMIQFSEATQIVGAAWFSFANSSTVRDFYIGNSTCYDASLAYGLSGYSATYNDNPNLSHFVVERVSCMGGRVSLSDEIDADEYSGYVDCHFDGMGWAATPNPNVKLEGISVGPDSTLPTGADGESRVQTGTTWADLFTDASEETPDFTPLGEHFLRSDGGWIGAKLPSGEWNLAA